MLSGLLREGVLRELPLLAGARRNVSLHIVLAQPDLMGPAARAAVEAFHGSRSHPTMADAPS